MSGAEAPRSFLQKACENCRLRKIRCDKQIPCASCQTLGIACQAAATRAAEHRPRIVVTSQYERQISLIHERLQGIESSLKRLSQNPPSIPQYQRPGNATTESSRPDSSITVYEGDSSFGNQTIQASELADATATTVVGASNELSSALVLLKDSLKRHEALSRTHETHLTARSQGGLPVQEELPPASLIIAMINRAKAHPPLSLVAFSCCGVTQLESLCQKVYFPLQKLPPGSMTFFYGLLFFVLRDYLSQRDPVVSGHDVQAYIDLCEAKFCAGLERFETLTVPVLPNIQALMIGAIKAQEECKLSLSWTFVAAAATMCHTLGYHRRSTLIHEDVATADIKRHIFWQLYMLDKNLSLNLGRSSNFQDSDIDAEFFTPDTNPTQRPWDMMTLATIVFAKVQGQVYDKLYSASAFSSSPIDRSTAISELSTQVLALRDQLVSIDVSTAHYHERLQGMVDCADFISCSVLTVIYRAQPSPGSKTEISAKCYDAARLSLESHLRCFAQFRDRDVTQQSEYVNWILLYPSFTPFTVVFIHAIATTDSQELRLLHETVRSLDHIKALSPAARRLHDVCAAFYRVAAAFIGSQQTLSGWHRRGDGTLSLPGGAGGIADASKGGGLGVENPSAGDGVGAGAYDSVGVMEQDQDALSAFLCSLAGNNRPLTDFLHMDLIDGGFAGIGDL